MSKSANGVFGELMGKPVIVRSTVAGVHCGILETVDAASCTVLLKDAYRLWEVFTRDRTGSMSDIAAHGLKEPLSQHSIGARLNSVAIVNPSGLEISEATTAAYKSIAAAAMEA